MKVQIIKNKQKLLIDMSADLSFPCIELNFSNPQTQQPQIFNAK